MQSEQHQRVIGGGNNLLRTHAEMCSELLLESQNERAHVGIITRGVDPFQIWVYFIGQWQ